MIALNALPAVSMRRLVPWSGPWQVDVDLELDATQVVPFGRVALTIGITALSGTIDPTMSGYFGSRYRARVIAGGGGWGQPATKQAYHSDGGVLAQVVIGATAASVGEVAVCPPVNLGTDFAVYGGMPASQVMRGLDWHVDALGITQVVPRVPVPLVDSDVQILSVDSLMQTATIATETVLEPGMILVDPRFGTAIIRQVEQTFDADGSRATVWLSQAVTSSTDRSLGANLARIARVACGVGALKTYKYRVALLAGTNKLALVAVSLTAGVPDQLPVKCWYGVPGVSSKPTLGAIVVVAFLEGDPAQPIVVAFDDTPPAEVDIAALIVKLGFTAQTGVATQATMVPLFFALSLLVTAINNMIGSPNAANLSLLDPTSGLQGQVTSAATAIITQLGLPTNFSATVGAAP